MSLMFLQVLIIFVSAFSASQESVSPYEAYYRKFVAPLYDNPTFYNVIQSVPGKINRASQRVDGLVKLDVRAWGPTLAKRTLIIVPGWTQTVRKDWIELVYDLTKRDPDLRVVVADLRGQGKSDHLVVGDSQRVWLDDAHKLVMDLHLVVKWSETLPGGGQNVTLMGHSLGGAVAIDYANRFPYKIDRLILEAPMLGINPPALKPLGIPVSEGLLKWLAFRFRNNGLGIKNLPTQWNGHTRCLHDQYREIHMSSRDRIKMHKEIDRNFPEEISAGASADYMLALKELADSLTKLGKDVKARRREFKFKGPIRTFLSKKDSIVKNGETEKFLKALDPHNPCVTNYFRLSRHAIHMSDGPDREFFIESLLREIKKPNYPPRNNPRNADQPRPAAGLR